MFINPVFRLLNLISFSQSFSTLLFLSATVFSIFFPFEEVGLFIEICFDAVLLRCLNLKFRPLSSFLDAYLCFDELKIVDINVLKLFLGDFETAGEATF